LARRAHLLLGQRADSISDCEIAISEIPISDGEIAISEIRIRAAAAALRGRGEQSTSEISSGA
jgi:hypothetical protein